MPDDTSLVHKRAILRKKILGVKIRHARNRAGLNLKEVGEALGVSPEIVAQVELGQRDVTLPQLEVMSLIFNVPLIYFWSDDIIDQPNLNFPTREALAVRQRIIGALLRQARTEAGRSIEDLANALGVPAEQISDYELGKSPIPLHQLETLVNVLNVSLNYFLDQGIAPKEANGHGATLDEIAQFSQLPSHVRQFISNPANLLYISIAMKLSDISADTLRDLAEGLLEITY
jgi:transcriptional regulator with XRE-family HTH domain